MRIQFIFLAGFFLFACNSNSTDKTSNDTTIEQGDTILPVKPADSLVNQGSVTGCYTKITGRDTIILQLDQSGNIVIGRLKYDNYEYDGSSGTVKGTIQDDLIKLYYESEAEGMHSVREIYFKNLASGLAEGTGTHSLQGDTSFYKTPVDIQYKMDGQLRRADCAVLNQRF